MSQGERIRVNIEVGRQPNGRYSAVITLRGRGDHASEAIPFIVAETVLEEVGAAGWCP